MLIPTLGYSMSTKQGMNRVTFTRSFNNLVLCCGTELQIARFSRRRMLGVARSLQLSCLKRAPSPALHAFSVRRPRQRRQIGFCRGRTREAFGVRAYSAAFFLR